MLPALLVLLVRLWVPESPRWLCRQGRYEEARKSLAWALQMEPSALPLPTAADAGPIIKTNWLDLFKYPRSLLVSWLGNAGAQTGVYGITLWAPSLFVLLLKVTPQEAAKMMILLSVSGFIGRLSFSYFSELLGRRTSGGLLGFRRRRADHHRRLHYDATLFGLSAFWLILAAAFFFADGGFAIVGPYAAEVWPSHLRTTGMGSAYGFGGIGKIIGPVGLALIVGSNNYLKPDVPLTQIPTGLPLSRLLVPDGGDVSIISSASKPAASRSSRSTGSCWTGPKWRPPQDPARVDSAAMIAITAELAVRPAAIARVETDLTFVYHCFPRRTTMPLGGLQHYTIEPQDLERPRTSIATCSAWRTAIVRRSISPATGSIRAASPPCT